ncbi:MAG: hypothetical protein Q9195_003413 [Heterodermia aff. obscurata]
MPKEHKKRGRREEKRKRERENGDQQATKRRRDDTEEEAVETKLDRNQSLPAEGVGGEGRSRPGEMPFYGMLDDEEQEYFKQADTVLELNQFPTSEERELFLANVYTEAKGKELKIANSQSCSRLMERLILSSTSSQLRSLFQTFNGHFLHLVQHRFASHCCETLFTQAAPLVTEELTAALETGKSQAERGEAPLSVEDLFLATLDELEGNLGYLMTDAFASHTLRVLLIVLAGRPIADVSSKNLIKSKKAENVSSAGLNSTSNNAIMRSRTVPSSFNDALDHMISSMVAGLDTTYLRALTTHPTGNPVLQLLIELELSRSGKTKAKDPASLFRKLLPDDPPQEGTESASFVNGLLYDTVGSRLLETIIQFAPGKTFKSLYKSLFRERLGSLARNEIASYPAIKILERLSKEEVQYAVAQICPLIGSLIERSRTAVIKVLIERCHIREIDTHPIAKAIQDNYSSGPAKALLKILNLDSAHLEGIAEDRQKQIEDQNVGKAHSSLLAQSMLAAPGPMRELIMEGLLAVDIPVLLDIAKDRSATRVLQTALVCPDQEASSKFRRITIQRLTPHAIDLAMDKTASHVIDAVWKASSNLKYPREQIALELAKSESVLRQCPSGKAVWRNWNMDLFKRNKTQWMRGDSGNAVANATFTQKAAKTGMVTEHKTPIELARERYAKGLPKPRKRGNAVSGGNSAAVKGKESRFGLKVQDGAKV